jgi:hypothetical protein
LKERDIPVLGDGFIPDDETNSPEHVCLFVVFVDLATRLVIKRLNRDGKH